MESRLIDAFHSLEHDYRHYLTDHNPLERDIRSIVVHSGHPAVAGPNTFHRDLHPDPAVRDADYFPATTERDSATLTAKPHRRACRRQDNDNPMPFNDSDTALRACAFLQREAIPQVVSEAKDNFRKDDPAWRDWQRSEATWTTEGCPQGERGGILQFGVPPKGNANFAWVQHIIHHLAPQGMVGFVLANGPAVAGSSNQSGQETIESTLGTKTSNLSHQATA